MTDLDNRFVSWLGGRRQETAELAIVVIGLVCCASVVYFWDVISLWSWRLAFLVMVVVFFVGVGVGRSVDNIRDNSWKRMTEKEIAIEAFKSIILFGGIVVWKAVYARWLIV